MKHCIAGQVEEAEERQDVQSGQPNPRFQRYRGNGPHQRRRSWLRRGRLNHLSSTIETVWWNNASLGLSETVRCLFIFLFFSSHRFPKLFCFFRATYRNTPLILKIFCENYDEESEYLHTSVVFDSDGRQASRKSKGDAHRELFNSGNRCSSSFFSFYFFSISNQISWLRFQACIVNTIWTRKYYRLIDIKLSWLA